MRKVQLIKLFIAAIACILLYGSALLALPQSYTLRVGLLGFATVSLLGALAVWRDVPKANVTVRVSSDGITKVCARGRVHIRWSEVVSVRNHRFPRGLTIQTAGRTKALRIDADIPNFSELLDLIVWNKNAIRGEDHVV